MNRKPTTHVVKIGSSSYWIDGGNTEMLIELAEKVGLKYDSIEPSKLSNSQKLIHVFGIGELADHLKTEEKKKNILDGNNLIAAFRGGKKRMIGNSEVWDTDFISELAGGIPPTHLKYHTSMEWIIPILELIETQGNIVDITLCLGKMCRIIKGSFKNPVITIANIESNDLKETLWMAAVEYVKWYNKQIE